MNEVNSNLFQIFFVISYEGIYYSVTFFYDKNINCLFQVSKRLQQELMSLMMSSDKGISAFPDGDKLFEWIATVHGPTDSVYEGKKNYL